MYFIYIIFVAILVAIDQLTKHLAILNLMGNGRVEIIPNLLNFVYVENRGAAWGMFSNNTFALSIISLIVTCFLIWILVNRKKYFTFKRIDFIILLIISGALGNFIDRFFRTYVVDFLEFGFISFPVFNMADVYVVVGSILLALVTIFFEKEDKAND
ncbi:MAG: signal peptidase II [Lachnospirales bacterium]